MLPQDHFNLAQFDAETANLYLVIDAPQKFDIAIGQIADQVSSLVQPRFGIRVQGVRDESLCGQLRAFEITASQAVTTDVQLARNTNRDRLQNLVQDENFGVTNRPSNRDRTLPVEL